MNPAFLRLILLITISYALISGCTPSISSSLSDVNTGIDSTALVQSKNQNLEGCLRFQDSPRKNFLLDQYVLYRDKIKAGLFEEAFDMWKVVYSEAPAADGKRSTVFRDGIKIYDYFFGLEKDEMKKAEYVERIISLYDEMIVCTGNKGYVEGLKAFDLYYSYKQYADEKEIFSLFCEALDSLEEETPAFVCNPLTALLVQLTFDDQVAYDEARKYADDIKSLIINRRASLSAADYKASGWDIVENYALSRLEELEGVQGFYGCDYYTEKYYSPIAEKGGECEELKTAYGRMRWGGCDVGSENIQKLQDALIAGGCVETRSAENQAVREAYQALEEGRYKEAVDLFERLAEETEKTDRKASFYFIISKIYYAHLKRYSLSRTFALKAASYKKNWGEPYLLIGKLYASSGPLCGPGRGWDSQIVTWPAIDKWEYARSIDSSVAAEATKLIEKYKEYMPSMEDIHQRTLKVGDSFTVGCWIQESTSIRPGKKF